MNEDLELFYDDSLQQLKFLENALLEVSQNGANADNIGEIFRSFHTIKGSAGMFDFELIVNFTHKAESLLDAIRHGKIVMSDDLVMLFFECKDHIETLLDSTINNHPLTLEALGNHTKLINILNHELGSASSSSSHNLQESATQMTTLNLHDFGKTPEPTKLWNININFGDEFFTSGMDIFSVLKFLTKQGEIVSIIANTDDIPNLEIYQPLKPYIKFEILYSSESSYDEIYEIFEFIIDDITLSIKQKESNEPKPIEIPTEQLVISQNNLGAANSIQKEKTATFRVDSKKVDSIINSMSQMVIHHGKILDIATKKFDDVDFIEELEEFSSLIEELRNSIMGVRLMPIGDSFGKFKRIVADTAKKLDKDVEFIIKGEDTEIDKTIIEKISDPLVHMLRNSIDHGLETKEERSTSGKNPKGQIILDVSVDGGTILIVISDDGKGINKQRVLEKAISNNLVKPIDKLSDKEIYNLIFAAGLSTAEQISDISGRGVGMDVVKANIEDLRGNVEVDSKAGIGSIFTIRLPSSLAIIDGLLVMVGNQKFIIAIENIVQCLEYTDAFVKKHQSDGFLNIYNELIPVVNTKKYFDEELAFGQRENIIIVRVGKSQLAILVDELIGELQCVLKPLGVLFENVVGINSATILGNGDIAFVFDIAKILEGVKNG